MLLLRVILSSCLLCLCAHDVSSRTASDSSRSPRRSLQDKCGTTLDNSTYPWLAVVFRNSAQGLEFLCEGTLVSREHVVTAAHCLYDIDEKPMNLPDVIVHLGRSSMAIWGEMDDASVHTVADINKNKDYRPSAPNAWTRDADIAVITLANAAAFPAHIQPACLDTSGMEPVYDSAVTVGWRKNFLNEIPDLIVKNTTILTDEICRVKHHNVDQKDVVANRTMCASFTGDQKSFDLKDSARPLYMKYKNSDGNESWALVGIMNEYIKGQNAYIYTRVADFSGWLQLAFHIHDSLSKSQSYEDKDAIAEEKRQVNAHTCARELPRQIEKYDQEIKDLQDQIKEAKDNFTQAREQENAARENLKSALSPEQVAILLYDIRGILKKDGMINESKTLLDNLLELPDKTNQIIKDTEEFKRRDEAKALELAVKNKNLNAVKCLMYEGGNIKQKFEGDNNALHLAAQTGQLQMYVWLAQQEGAERDARNKNGETPNQLAVSNNLCDENSIEWMIKNDVKDMNPDGNTILHAAIEKAPIETITCLLDHKFSDGAVEDKDQNNGIHFAATRGDIDILKLLFRNKADISVNLRNKDGNTPLHLAAKNDRTEVAKYLVLEKGAEFKDAVNYESYTPLQVAVTQGNDIAYFFIDEAKKKNVTLKHADFSANKVGEPENAINVQDLEGNTPLHVAAKKGNVELVKKLVTEGADRKIKNNEKQIPYDVASAEVKEYFESLDE